MLRREASWCGNEKATSDELTALSAVSVELYGDRLEEEK